MKTNCLINSVLIISCAVMIGCQNNKVPCYTILDEYQFLKNIENKVFQPNVISAPKSKERIDRLPPLPDYFDFRRAVEAYEEGRGKALQVVVPSSIALSVYGESNLVAQAIRDGFEEQQVRNLDIVLARNRIRNQRQLEFWGKYHTEGKPDGGSPIEVTSMTTNCYVYLMSSFEKGYRNGYRVVAKLRRSPIATNAYLVRPNLCADMLKRAYVYGWYSACYDFFEANPDLYYADKVLSGMDPRNFYSLWISAFKRIEGRFLHENAAKKEFVKEGEAVDVRPERCEL